MFPTAIFTSLEEESENFRGKQEQILTSITLKKEYYPKKQKNKNKKQTKNQ